MDLKRVRCPDCTVILEIPESYKGNKVRCSVCKTGFRLPIISDAEILDWIGPRDKDDTAHDLASPSEAAVPEAPPAPATTAPTAAPPRSAPVQPAGINHDNEHLAVHLHTDEQLPAGREGFSLLRVDNRGPLFEFPALFLEDPEFRAAMPHRCLRCGVTTHLKPHVVVYSHQMSDSSAVESDHLEGPIQICVQDLAVKPTRELIDAFPKLRNLPEPADQPMPFWVCDMCSPSKMVFAQNEINRRTHEGHCHLQIQRIWRAEEFLANVGGEDSPAHQLLKTLSADHQETPWDTLAGVVQQRLRQWYRPGKGERFVAYMPDRRRARTEDGMAGIVVTNRRLIYNSSMRHKESDKGEPLELDFAMDGGRLKLHIKAPNWEIKNLIADKPGLNRLRRALTREGFAATWH